MGHILVCYRVWFADGTALLVDADSIESAKVEAYRLADEGRNLVPIDKVEQLTARLIG
jgi:hypothetical protein